MMDLPNRILQLWSKFLAKFTFLGKSVLSSQVEKKSFPMVGDYTICLTKFD